MGRYHSCKQIHTKQQSPKYIKQISTELKKELDISTIILGDINSLLSLMDRKYRWKIKKEIEYFSDTKNQLALKDIYRVFFTTTVEYIFFSSVHGTISRIEHILGHKTSFSKFKKIKITQSFLSNLNGMKLEIRSKLENSQDLKIKQHTFKQPMGLRGNHKGNSRYFETN